MKPEAHNEPWVTARFEVTSDRKARGLDVVSMISKNATRFLTNSIAKSALSLYVVQLTKYVIPLVAVPFLTRVLRPDGWGLVVFTQSFGMWLSLVMEYGFSLSATRDVSRNSADQDALSTIVCGVMGAKVVLGIVLAIVVGVTGLAMPLLREHPRYLLLAWLIAVAQGLSPLWYFQGLERMHLPALLNVASRLVSTILVFLVVDGADDGWKVLAYEAGAGFISSGLAVFMMYREVSFGLPNLAEIGTALRRGWSMFFFRGAVSLYTTSNTIILGLFVPPTVVGFYAGAERISRSVIGLMTPISQVVFPRISRLVVQDPVRAVRLGKLSLLLMGVLGIGMGCMLALGSEALVQLFFGAGYEAAVPLLRLLALLVPIVALSNVLGIQWMLPHGLDRLFNIIIAIAGLINIMLAFVLVPVLGPLGMVYAVIISEGFVTMSMCAVLCKRGLMPVGGWQKNES